MIFEKSQAAYERALNVSPLGAQTASKAPGRVGPLGAFPLYLAEARGAVVTDVDMNRFIDWFNGNCAVTFGHGHKYVAEMVQKALSMYGALPSLATALEARVAERLCEVIPCAESLRFVKTGSESCAAAVRIARIATGRDVIVCAEGQYHGWHDWHCVTKAKHPGVPSALGPLVRTFDLANPVTVLDSLNFRDRDVAALMIEPALPHLPDADLLRKLVDRAHEAGALVIFDEMICGARLHLGGAQAYARVTPDLACFGKAYANGFPLAFVCGSRELMAHAWPISGTFGGEICGLAAADAMLDLHGPRMMAYADVEYVSTISPIQRIAQVGRLLTDGFNGIAERLGLATRMVGHPCRPYIDWRWRDATDVNLVRSVFQQELAARGVLAHWSGWNPSVAHAPHLLERTLTAIDGALATLVAASVSAGGLEEALRGQPIGAALTRVSV